MEGPVATRTPRVDTLGMGCVDPSGLKAVDVDFEPVADANRQRLCRPSGPKGAQMPWQLEARSVGITIALVVRLQMPGTQRDSP